MTSYESVLLAFGGGVLEGDNFVRWVYVDEAGISSGEKCCTVAGTIIHADRHHHKVKACLDRIRNNLPDELQADLVFHAKDIWHGNKQFNKDKWLAHGIDKDERRSIVEQICSIPAELNLPVVYGFVHKAGEAGNWRRLAKEAGNPKLNPDRLSYAMAFGQCVVMAEAYIRDHCSKREVGQIVAEDTRDMREYGEWAYSLLERTNAPWSDDINHYIPLRRLAEGPNFAAKRRSAILQVADSIAFVLNRHYTLGVPDSDVAHCYKRLWPQISYPMVSKDFGDYF